MKIEVGAIVIGGMPTHVLVIKLLLPTPLSLRRWHRGSIVGAGVGSADGSVGFTVEGLDVEGVKVGFLLDGLAVGSSVGASVMEDVVTRSRHAVLLPALPDPSLAKFHRTVYQGGPTGSVSKPSV